jgi:hypothetical protein
MFAHILRKISFWSGVAAIGALPLVPVVYQWLYPPKTVKVEQSLAGFAWLAVDILGTMGDGILVMVWISGFAVAAVVASLIAFIAAWVTRESRRTKLLCWLPALVAVIELGVLAATGA